MTFKEGDIIKRINGGNPYSSWDDYALKNPDALFVICEKIKLKLSTSIFIIMNIATHETFKIKLTDDKLWKKLA